MKRCSACGQEKPADAFHVVNVYTRKLSSKCKPCASAYGKRWREARGVRTRPCEECGKPSRKGVLCFSCKTEAPSTRVCWCTSCNRPFASVSAKWCPVCRAFERRERKRARDKRRSDAETTRNQAARTERMCEGCGKVYRPVSKSQKYCSGRPCLRTRALVSQSCEHCGTIFLAFKSRRYCHGASCERELATMRSRRHQGRKVDHLDVICRECGVVMGKRERGADGKLKRHPRKLCGECLRKAFWFKPNLTNAKTPEQRAVIRKYTALKKTKGLPKELRDRHKAISMLNGLIRDMKGGDI